jgi:hypothetical protein
MDRAPRRAAGCRVSSIAVACRPYPQDFREMSLSAAGRALRVGGLDTLTGLGLIGGGALFLLRCRARRSRARGGGAHTAHEVPQNGADHHSARELPRRVLFPIRFGQSVRSARKRGKGESTDKSHRRGSRCALQCARASVRLSAKRSAFVDFTWYAAQQ